MNISSTTNSSFINNITNNKASQKIDSMSSATKTQGAQKVDTMTSATTKNGGDHSFEAKA